MSPRITLISWQLVDRRLAQDAADARDARIARRARGRAVDAIRRAHRAQFVDREETLEAAGALLLEKDRAAVFDQDSGAG